MGDHQDSGVQLLDTIQARLNRLHDSGSLSWRKIAALPDYQGIPAGTLCAIAKGREPKKKEHRKMLGLPPAAVEVDPCPDCGEAHTVPFCTKEYGDPIKPPKPQPNGRKSKPRKPYKNIDPTDPAQVQRQIERYMPGWELIRKEGRNQ
jgi:hypothetical protein